MVSASIDHARQLATRFRSISGEVRKNPKTNIVKFSFEPIQILRSRSEYDVRADERVEFEAFYSEQVGSGVPFCPMRVSKAYCVNDVAVKHIDALPD